MRVSHADRDRVVEILREAAGDGRVDAQELDERLERALTARTFAELEPLTRDLPGPPLVPPGVAVDASGVQGFGGSVRDRSVRRVDPSVPVAHVITVVGSVHGGSVKVRSSHSAGGGRRDRRVARRALRAGRRSGGLDGGAGR